MLERDRHEQILNDLNNPELTHTDRAELLQELRQGHAQGLGTIETNTATLEQLEKENTDLVKANSKLFREGGITLTNDDNTQVNEEDLSVEDLMKGSGM